MKLARLGDAGAEVPVVIEDDRVHDLRGLTADIDGTFLARGGLSSVRESLATDSLPVLRDAASRRVGAPIARPSAVVCVGLNYVAHAAESGVEPPESPVIFLKTPNTVVGPDDDVFLPPGSVRTDWEVELGVVIGRHTSYLGSPSESRDHIAGYVIADDLSERQFQLEESGGQWSKGKCAPGFTPVGPWLVPGDEVDPTALTMQSWVNGEVRQHSSSSDMVFGVDHLVWHLSQYLAFEPGDLLLTGTPEGVALSGRFPYLKEGDVVELEIDGLGRQRHCMHPGPAGRVAEADGGRQSVPTSRRGDP